MTLTELADVIDRDVLGAFSEGYDAIDELKKIAPDIETRLIRAEADAPYAALGRWLCEIGWTSCVGRYWGNWYYNADGAAHSVRGRSAFAVAGLSEPPKE